VQSLLLFKSRTSSLCETSVLKLQLAASTMPLNCKPLPIKANHQTATKATSFGSLPEMSVLKLQLAAFTKSLNRKPLLPIKVEQIPSKAKRSVRFSNINSTVTSTLEISEEELRTMWYKDEEYSSFKQECRRTLTAIKTAKGKLSALDPTEYSVQGLEQFLSTKQMASRKKKAKRYIDVMMRQQYVQKRTGRSDPSRLKSLSEMFSKQAGQRAYLRGVIDHALTVGHIKEIRRERKRRNGMSML
jgi:hypothetical protein